MISDRFVNNKKPYYKLNNIQFSAKSEVEAKIENGTYSFENISCPICKSISKEVIAEKDRYGLECTTVICKDCGAVYTNPRMTQESYNEFYDKEYRKLYVGTETATERFFEGQINQGRRIYNYIEKTFPGIRLKNRNILEVGCGAAGILYYFKQKSNNVLGVDLGSEYLEYSREKYGMNLIHGSLSEVPSNFNADVVIYSHVFEHILDFEKEIQALKKFCTKDTILYIEVPGVKFVHRAYKMDFLNYFQNAHTIHFSLTSLKNIFQSNGFSFISGDEYVRSVFKLNLSYKTNKIINDYASVSEYIKRIEKKRFLYPISLTNIKIKIKFVLIKILGVLQLKKVIKKVLKRS